MKAEVIFKKQSHKVKKVTQEANRKKISLHKELAGCKNSIEDAKKGQNK